MFKDLTEYSLGHNHVELKKRHEKAVEALLKSSVRVVRLKKSSEDVRLRGEDTKVFKYIKVGG